jgi:hypothetical protein
MEILYLVLGALFQFLLDLSYKKVRPFIELRKLSNVLPLSSGNKTREIFIRASLEVLAAGGGEKSKRAYTHSSETLSLQLLTKILHGTPVMLKFQYEDTSHGDWIILGLSRKSKISQVTIDEIKSRSGITIVKGEGSHQFFSIPNGETYRCVHVPDPEFETLVTKDYGIIYRSVNDQGNVLLLCGGIHMFGTQAAVEVAFSDAFIKHVRDSGAHEYAQIVEVSVLPDGLTIDPASVKWRNLPFVVLR